MVALPFAEELVYTNFELNEHDIYALNYTYSCELEYGGEIYRFSTSYYKPEKVAETEYEAHEMCGIRLTHMNSGDICTFYTDVAPDLREDLEVFLNKTYDIKQYLTFDLPEGTWLGDFTLYVNDIYDGCLILGDFEEQPHSENAAKAWYAPGSIGVVQNMITGDTNIMEFEQGKPVSVRWYSNHSGFITKGEYLDGCEMPAILYEGEFDLFTAAESVEYMEKNKISSEDFDGTSEYWYVFFGEEDSEYIYYVALNQAYFAKEDVIALARSVKFTEQ